MCWRRTEVHAGDVLASLERDVFPTIGAMPIGAVTVPVILNALRVIEERGSLVTASRVRQRISAVFAYAMAHELADQNPAAIVSRALTPPALAQHHPALLEIEDARALLGAAELVHVAPVVKRASRFRAPTQSASPQYAERAGRRLRILTGHAVLAGIGHADEARGSEEP